MASPTAISSGLRPALSSFVGRRHELAQLRALLSASRLVTITGAGGAGKTRLAEEFAASIGRSLNGSVAVAYLAGASTGSDVVEIVAASVGLRHMGTGSVEAELAVYLENERLLLVLDNCEHVIAPAAELAAELLRSCPCLLIIATGRRPLHVPGEQLFPIEGLPTAVAVELFLERARLSVPDLVLGTSDLGSVEAICTRLDGMPLAIELAAGRVRSLGVVELAERLDGHLTDLVSRSSLAPERQRTLLGTIGWSYGLLDPAQQAVWRRVAIFSGGFTLAEAEEVVAFPPIASGQVAEVLGDLVDQSMVVYEPSLARYRLLEALREFATERLADAGEKAITAERHRRWMVDLAADTDQRWFGPDQVALVNRMHTEAGNLRAALENCREADAAGDGLRLANGAAWYWLVRTNLKEGRDWYRAFLGRSGDPTLEAAAHWRAAYMANLRLDFPSAHALLDRGFEYAAASGSALEQAFVRGMRGSVTVSEPRDGSEEGRRFLRETFEDPAADGLAREGALVGYAFGSQTVGDLDASRRASLAAVEIGRQSGELWLRELGLRHFAHAEWQLGRPDAAETALLEGIRIDRALDDLWHLAWSTETLGWVTVDTARYERGARLLGIAAGLWAQTGAHRGDPLQTCQTRALEQLRTHLGARQLERELAVGRTLSRSDAYAFALGEAVPVAGEAKGRAEPLSAREIEVAALVADGLSNRAIAERLFLSPRTVAKHVEHIMDKLDLGSRAEIAAWHARRSV